MICAACHRRINKPSALSHGLPVGPVCAERLGLLASRLMGLTPGKREHAPVVQDGQLKLFEVTA